MGALLFGLILSLGQSSPAGESIQDHFEFGKQNPNIGAGEPGTHYPPENRNGPIVTQQEAVSQQQQTAAQEAASEAEHSGGKPGESQKEKEETSPKKTPLPTYKTSIPSIGGGREATRGLNIRNPGRDRFIRPEEEQVETVPTENSQTEIPSDGTNQTSYRSASSGRRLPASASIPGGKGISKSEFDNARITPDGKRFKEASSVADTGKIIRQWERLMRDDPSGAKAIAFIENARHANPDDIEIRRKHIESLNKAGRYSDAIREAIEVLKKHRNDPVLYREAAWSSLHMGRHEEALKYINMAIDLDEGNPVFFAIRAFIHEAMGNRSLMIRDLAIAARLAPSRFSGHLKIAKSGGSIFDASASDSKRLLQALTEIPKSAWGSVHPGIWLGGLAFLGLGLGFIGSLILSKRKVA